MTDELLEEQVRYYRERVARISTHTRLVPPIRGPSRQSGRRRERAGRRVVQLRRRHGGLDTRGSILDPATDDEHATIRERDRDRIGSCGGHRAARLERRVAGSKSHVAATVC